MKINITVKNKIVSAPADVEIVCGNSNYTIEFDFDEEWASVEKKTARFKWTKNDESKHKDVEFTGNTVSIPILTDIRSVYVGVYAGDLQTTTPLRIKCKRSILCGDTSAEDVSPDVWVQLLEENDQQDSRLDKLEESAAAVDDKILDTLVAFEVAPVLLDTDGAMLVDGDGAILINV